MTLRARDLLSPRVLKVPAEARPVDYRESGAHRAFAVFDDETFVGVVDLKTALKFPYRIFADLCRSTPSPPLLDSAAVGDLLREMEQRERDVLPVVESGGRYLGVVSLPQVTEALLSQARTKLAGLEELVGSGMDLGTSLNFEVVLQRIVELATKLIDARCGALGVADEHGRIGKFFVAGVDEATKRAIGRPPESMALLGELLRDGRALRLPDISRHPRFSGFPPHHPAMRSFLGMAIRYGDRILGDLYLADKRDAPEFTEEDEELLLAFAAQAAVAVENARLYELVTRRMREQDALVRLSQGFLAAGDLQEVLDHAVAVAAEMFGVELCKILLPDEDGKNLRLASGVGWDPGLVGVARVGKGTNSQAGYTLEEKGPVVVWELATENRFSGPPLLTDHGVVSGMSVPMLAGERAIGVMGAHSRSHRRFTPEEVRLFSLIANQTAVAIERMKLIEETRRQREEALALEEIGREIASSLDRDEIFQRIVDRTQAVCGGDIAFLASWDQRAGNATVVATSGARTDLLKTLSFAPGAGLAGGALKTGEPFMTEDFSHDPRRLRLHGEVAIQEGFVAVAVVPLRLKGTITGLLWVVNRNPRRFTIRDISLQTKLADQAALALENSRLYEELRQALKRVEESQQQVIQGERLRALGQMAAGVAHDFNNVLTTILGRAQLLLAETKDPELERQLRPIERVAMDGAHTVRRIQEFARKRRARPFLPVDLNRVVQEVLEITRSRWKDEAEGRGIHYDLLVEANPIPKLSGDAAELREALTNILFNALDVMPEGGRITFRTGVGGDRVFCAVTDTGVGMTDEVKQRLFDPFFTTKEEKGTGLGLSMVYGIVTRHGGEIEVQSRVREGSSFTLWFPPGSPPSELLTKTPIARPSRSAKVLVIEDLEEVREVLRELLASGGHTVFAYETGTAGLSHLQSEPFDLVITDLGMPRVSGWEVARLAKLHRPETPVALITGWGDQIDPGEARQKGVDFLVSKPFTQEDVFSVVAQALDRWDLKPR